MNNTIIVRLVDKLIYCLFWLWIATPMQCKWW